MPTKKSTGSEVPIIVKLGRLGDSVREFALPKGIQVKDVLKQADIDGDTTTVKINGKKVALNAKLTGNCTLVAMGEFEGGSKTETKDEETDEQADDSD